MSGGHMVWRQSRGARAPHVHASRTAVTHTCAGHTCRLMWCMMCEALGSGASGDAPPAYDPDVYASRFELLPAKQQVRSRCARAGDGTLVNDERQA